MLLRLRQLNFDDARFKIKIYGLFFWRWIFLRTISIPFRGMGACCLIKLFHQRCWKRLRFLVQNLCEKMQAFHSLPHYTFWHSRVYLFGFNISMYFYIHFLFVQLKIFDINKNKQVCLSHTLSNLTFVPRFTKHRKNKRCKKSQKLKRKWKNSGGSSAR